MLHYNFNSVSYLLTYNNCFERYVGSATNFKNHFRTHKSDIKTNKDRCGTAKHFNGLSVQIIVMPETLKKFYGTVEIIDKASYLLRLMA